MTTATLAKSLGLVSYPLQQRQFYPSKRAQTFAYFIVLDFEATCWQDKEKQPHKSEIIEFPAVLLDSGTGKIEDEFHEYVMPTECQILPEFCRKLTGIKQEWVDVAAPLPTVMKLFSDWLNKICAQRNIVINPGEKPAGDKKSATFVTWSDWDLGTMLLYECKRKSIFRASHFNAWTDLRLVYRTYYKTRPQGLNGAIEERGMLFVGQEHSGIDDARNTAKLVFKMIIDGCLFKVTKAIQGKKVMTLKSASAVVSNPARRSSSSGYTITGAEILALSVTPPLCKCGVLSARKKTSNGGPNHGRGYFTCKSAKGQSCGFYVWESSVVKEATGQPAAARS